MSEWKLKDCCLSISDGDHLPPPKAESGIPFITISNIDATNHIDFGNTGISATDTISGVASGTVNKVLGAIQWIGYAIAVGMLLYIGIKYVMASANEKADLKNSLVRYLIGAILI